MEGTGDKRGEQRRQNMNTMANAPKDGTEILAYHIDGRNYHPVIWKKDHWGMRWNPEYSTQDGFYSHWISYPIGPYVRDKGVACL